MLQTLGSSAAGSAPDMASSERLSHASSLQVSAIQIVDLVSDEDSADGTLDNHFDRGPDASNGVEAVDSDDDADDDNWSLYEDVLDVIESDEIIPGGAVPVSYYKILASLVTFLANGW